MKKIKFSTLINNIKQQNNPIYSPVNKYNIPKINMANSKHNLFSINKRLPETFLKKKNAVTLNHIRSSSTKLKLNTLSRTNSNSFSQNDNNKYTGISDIPPKITKNFPDLNKKNKNNNILKQKNESNENKKNKSLTPSIHRKKLSPKNNPNNTAIKFFLPRSSSANNILHNQFITALNFDKNKNSTKINQPKKFLTFFDKQKIDFLDRTVYKPNKRFEYEVNKLKRNNSTKAIKNFNIYRYKNKVLKIFNNEVSYKNFDVLKKNFGKIIQGWNANLKFHFNRPQISPKSATERELIISNAIAKK